MKLLFENWRKVMEGDVIDFPGQPDVSKEYLQQVIGLETAIGELLGEIYHDQYNIPVDVLDRMEELVMSVEESLKNEASS